MPLSPPCTAAIAEVSTARSPTVSSPRAAARTAQNRPAAPIPADTAAGRPCAAAVRSSIRRRVALIAVRSRRIRSRSGVPVPNSRISFAACTLPSRCA